MTLGFWSPFLPDEQEMQLLIEAAFERGRSLERGRLRDIVTGTACVRDGWHPFTALALQAELLSALDHDANRKRPNAAHERAAEGRPLDGLVGRLVNEATEGGAR